LAQGGGWFSTHVKTSHPCDVVIANGSECEPLLANDKVLMEEEASLIVEGLKWAVKATGNKRGGVIALKGKGSKAELALLEAVKNEQEIEIFNLGDYYPVGDEFILVQGVTGRVVPERDIPLSIGAVVLNVETLRNVTQAVQGKPVIERTLTSQGKVRRPSVLRMGTPFWEVFEQCWGVTVSDYMTLVGGPMMGSVVSDPLTPVTKATTGLFVLPKDHTFVRKKTLPLPFIIKQSKASCCQCTYCTEFCPCYLLEHDLAPHKIMRQINLRLDVPPQVVESAFLCSGCGLCEIFVCPMELSPE